VSKVKKDKKNKLEKSAIEEKEIKDTKIVGKKFEDLEDEEMNKLQGSGDDVRGEIIGTITTLLSKKDYKC
jgi:type 2 lantibiotic, SP_1948 family